MISKRTCFVISPIGDDGSPTRTNADDVFDLLIQPALEPFHFDVVRADKIPGPSSITEDVIRLVQESDLCVVDLTERNPNVFYECGRRHEAGKPAILIIKKGERIPFDLAGIRTITYDMSDPRTTRATVKVIQEFVREIEKGGFAEVSSGATLTNIVDILARMERKISALQDADARLPGSSPFVRGGIKNLMLNPQAALQEALIKGDLAAVVSLLPRVEKLLGPSDALVAAAGVAAINGEGEAVEMLYRMLETTDERLKASTRTAALASIVQYYVGMERAAEGVRRLPAVVNRLLARPDNPAKEIAFIHNQLQMLYYDAKMYQEALEESEKTLAAYPSETAYWYNLSLIYDKLSLPKKALEAVEKYLAMGATEGQHLSHAYEVFNANRLYDKASEVLQKLKQQDPVRAAFVEMQGPDSR